MTVCPHCHVADIQRSTFGSLSGTDSPGALRARREGLRLLWHERELCVPYVGSNIGSASEAGQIAFESPELQTGLVWSDHSQLIDNYKSLRS